MREVTVVFVSCRTTLIRSTFLYAAEDIAVDYIHRVIIERIILFSVDNVLSDN